MITRVSIMVTEEVFDGSLWSICKMGFVVFLRLGEFFFRRVDRVEVVPTAKYLEELLGIGRA